MGDDSLHLKVLSSLDSDGDIADSSLWCDDAEGGETHLHLIGVIKSLEALEKVKASPFEKKWHTLTAEGAEYAVKGSPEYQVFHAVQHHVESSSTGMTQKQLDTLLGASLSKIGYSKAMQNKLITLDKETKTIHCNNDMKDAEDKIQTALKEISSTKDISSSTTSLLTDLKKRRLVAEKSITCYSITKGDAFSLTLEKKETDLTADMLASKQWKACVFKDYNYNSIGKILPQGHLHPLLKVRGEVRQNLLLMGFEEMKTNQWIVPSFWNFDALFQPQQHPARDAHDTFFLKSPQSSLKSGIDSSYFSRVKEMHESGDAHSIGWRYKWSEEEALKNVLRTHTTACSSQMLYRLAVDCKKQQEDGKEGFTPKKYFSIDRVFRNETLDATHLAEFHQVEGVVADRNLNLRHLKGVIKEFFNRMGINTLRFKPAYNPYTEPSMEIFGYHPLLKKWVEVGNSGIFRPEMLAPMQLPSDVRVIAWGLGLERPTMIQYGISNIRELFGHKIDITKVQNNPICWLKRSEDKPEGVKA